jgi:hypothetical protein
MFRKLALLAVIGVLATAAFASAAWMPVNGGTIAAGDDYTLSCAPNGLSVMAYGLNTLAGPQEGVEYVTIAPPPAACNGARLFARVELYNGTQLYSNGSNQADIYSWVTIGTTPLDGNGGYALYLQAGQPGPIAWPKAEDIKGIKLWLEGPTQ